MLDCSDGLTSQCQGHTIRVKVKISSAFELSTKLESDNRFVFVGYHSELSQLYGMNENVKQGKLYASVDHSFDVASTAVGCKCPM